MRTKVFKSKSAQDISVLSRLLSDVAEARRFARSGKVKRGNATKLMRELRGSNGSC